MSFYYEYWNAFMEELSKRPSFPLRPVKIYERNWLSWSCFRHKGFKLIASLRKDQDWVCINFGIDAKSEKHHFQALYEKQREIDRSVGTTLRWVPIFEEKSDTQAILITRGVDVTNRTAWPNQHAWMLNGLEKLYTAFMPHVESLPRP